MVESEEELKSLLMKVKEESEKARLKLSVQNTKIMASISITSWQKEGEQPKQWQILFSWVTKPLQMMTAAMKLIDTCSIVSYAKYFMKYHLSILASKGWRMGQKLTLKEKKKKKHAFQ